MRHSHTWGGATVRGITELSPSVREFQIAPDSGTRPWAAGAHLPLQVRIDGRTDTRTYSLVGLPQPEVYRLAVKRIDASRGGSRFMWRLAVGDRLNVALPNNHFQLVLDAPHTLLVAGGIGITPLLGAALTLATRGASLRLCYAAREAAELVYADALRAALGSRLRTFVGAMGERIDLAAEINALPALSQLLVCGPIPLLREAQSLWSRSGRPAHLLHFETFGAGGAKPAEAFWVRLPRHGVELQVPADRSLLDVLNQHGIETLYDCRRGECGLCTLDILSAHGEVDHRDVYLSSQQRQANRRLCACVSRVSGGGVVLDTAYRADSLFAF